MKYFIYTLSICFIAFLNFHCGNAEQDDSDITPIDTTSIALDTHLVGTETYYVLASSGLRMRNEPSLKSEKLDVVAYGEKVQIDLNDVSEQSVVSNGLKGQMVKTYYKDQEGYMFKGYLSSIPVPEEKQSIAEYAHQLNKKGFSAKFDSVEEELGAEDILSIPALNLQEAFLIGQRLDIFEMDFDLPSNAKPSSIITRPNGQKTTIDRQEEIGPDGVYQFILPNDSEKSYIFLRMIGLKYNSDGLAQIIYTTAYEGGSWTCTLSKEGSFYVFRKMSVAD